MNTQEALKLVGGLSKPSKMPGWAYGIRRLSVKTAERAGTNAVPNVAYGKH
jgi:hypothetical protein